MSWWLRSAQHACDCRLSDPSLQHVGLLQISLLTFLPQLSETMAKYSNVSTLTGQSAIPDLIRSLKLTSNKLAFLVSLHAHYFEPKDDFLGRCCCD